MGVSHLGQNPQSGALYGTYGATNSKAPEPFSQQAGTTAGGRESVSVSGRTASFDGAYPNGNGGTAGARRPGSQGIVGTEQSGVIGVVYPQENGGRDGAK